MVDDGLVPIQGSGTTLPTGGGTVVRAVGHGPVRVGASPTELARSIAVGFGWKTNLSLGYIYTRDGTLVADSLEKVAGAMDQLGHFIFNDDAGGYIGIHWTSVDEDALIETLLKA